MRATLSRLALSMMRQARPEPVPDPATNSATTAPINASPPEIFIPANRYGSAVGSCSSRSRCPSVAP